MQPTAYYLYTLVREGGSECLFRADDNSAKIEARILGEGKDYVLYGPNGYALMSCKDGKEDEFSPTVGI